MGYYTRFTIKIKTKLEKQNWLEIYDLNEAMFEVNEEHKHVFDNTGDEIYSDGGIKWYDYHEDMVKLSKMFPNLVLQVDGEGEETGDIWRTFWKNGKYQEAERVVTVEGEETGDIWRTFWKNGKYQEAERVVTVEDYDENKLK
jgi:hypothetical protein